MLGLTCWNKNAMKIVWRNPNPVRHHPRRHTCESTGQCALYVLQEFVEDGYAGRWKTISDLEVVVGGRAA